MMKYQPYLDKYRNELKSLIHGLYIEDPEGETMTDEKIDSTIDFLSDNPTCGEIILFAEDETILGYSILINYWSNEFGGLILFVDELYVRKEHRNKNIGTNFLKYLFSKNVGTYRAILLEVFPSNKKALDFYVRNGFVRNEGNYLKRVL